MYFLSLARPIRFSYLALGSFLQTINIEEQLIYFYLSCLVEDEIYLGLTFFPFSCFSTSLDLIAGLFGWRLGLEGKGLK